jgi:GMP synthase (glutamine-hydrolysing)
VDFGETGKRAIAIRTFMTSDFMTGIPACPGKQIPEAAYVPPLVARRLSIYERTLSHHTSHFRLTAMVEGILAKVPGIARVCYDLTSKPPATTEWE